MSSGNVEFRTLLSNVEKTDVNVASSYAEHGENGKAMPSTAASSSNTHTTDRVKPEK